MIAFFKTILFIPILNAVILLYNILPPHDLGIVIIILTLFIRFLLSPLSYKAARAQKEIAKIQPKIKKIQKKYEENKEKQAQKLMEVYREHKVNPLTGILPLLVQLPIIIALYRVFISVLDNNFTEGLYAFVQAPEAINPYFLNFINLGERSIPIALAAGAFQLVHSLLIAAKKDQKDKKSLSQIIKKGDFKLKDITQTMGSQMTLFMPIFTVVIAISLPAGLPLYWMTTTIFSIGEQLLVKKRNEDKKDREETDVDNGKDKNSKDETKQDKDNHKGEN